MVAVAPALGPTVGGLVGTFMPWRWIFVILLPFLFVSLVCGLKTIHQVTPTEEAHINPLHVLCLAVGFVCFVFALDRGGSAVTAVSNGDTSATTQCVIAVVLLLIAMAALLVFAWVSHRAFSPLVRLTVLRSVKFRWHLLAYVLAAVCDDRLRLYDSERFATGIRRVCACCRRGVAAWRVAGSG